MPQKDREAYNAYMRKYMLRRYHERRRYAIKLLGGKCAKCGSRSKLEIDHIEPKKKSFSIGKLWSVSKKRFEAELRKCQLLCERHHSDKTLADKGQARARGMHGTLSSYRYCKCAKCRAANSEYGREYRRRKAGV
jgi:5-methylcytosine-specific restriction endonuclease McrA